MERGRMRGKPVENAVREFTFSLDELAMTPGRVARVMGYAEPPPHLQEALDRCFTGLARHAAPCGGFRLCNGVRFADKSFECEGAAFEPGSRIAGYLKKSESLAFFLVTAGPGIDAWSKQAAAQGDLLLQYVIDTAGSEIAEAAADRIEEEIAAVAQEHGFKTTNRYSPGYCGWHVSGQHGLFSLLPENFCGIALTPSSLMVPIKSVSGVIGLGANAGKKEYQCSICDMKNCIRRGKK
jgi:hypothetical protein